MGLQVADLFATLGLRPDDAAWRRGDKLIQNVKTGLAAFAGFAAVKKVTEAVSSVVDLGGHLFDTAQKTGLAVEALQEYGYIAGQNSSSLDEFSGAVTKLSRGLDDAARTGKGPAADALRRLGLSLNDPKFKNATLDDKITMIAEHLNKFPDGVKKTAIAMDLFGKSGANLIPTLNQIAEEGADARAEFRDMGGELSGDDAAGLDTLGDTLDKAKAQLGALKNQVVVALVPALQSMVDGLLAWVKANRELIASGIRAAVEALMIVFKGLGVAVKVVAGILEFFAEHAEVAKAVLIALGLVIGAIAGEAAAAWLIAAAPVVGFIAAIAAVILIFQDLLKGLLTGKGVIAGVLHYVGDQFKRLYQAIKGAFDSIGHLFSSIAQAIKGAFEAVIDWITDKIDWAWAQVKKIGHALAHPIDTASDFFLGSDDTSSGPITSPSQVPTRTITGSSGAPVTYVDAPSNVTINASGVDPQGVVDIANRQIAKHHDDTWRDVDAATGGGDQP